jgi:hypothetical protein
MEPTILQGHGPPRDFESHLPSGTNSGNGVIAYCSIIVENGKIQISNRYKQYDGDIEMC